MNKLFTFYLNVVDVFFECSSFMTQTHTIPCLCIAHKVGFYAKMSKSDVCSMKQIYYLNLHRNKTMSVKRNFIMCDFSLRLRRK